MPGRDLSSQASIRTSEFMLPTTDKGLIGNFQDYLYSLCLFCQVCLGHFTKTVQNVKLGPESEGAYED